MGRLGYHMQPTTLEMYVTGPTSHGYAGTKKNQKWSKATSENHVKMGH